MLTWSQTGSSSPPPGPSLLHTRSPPQGEAIAYNLREMFGLRVPLISVVIGEGGSGGALAIGCANRNLIMENSVYYVASPEACAAILWKSRNATGTVGGAWGARALRNGEGRGGEGSVLRGLARGVRGDPLEVPQRDGHSGACGGARVGAGRGRGGGPWGSKLCGLAGGVRGLAGNPVPALTPPPLNLPRQATEALRITAPELVRLGVMDTIIPEPLGGAHADPVAAFPAIKDAIMATYREYEPLSEREIQLDRWEVRGCLGLFFARRGLPRRAPGSARERGADAAPTRCAHAGPNLTSTLRTPPPSPTPPPKQVRQVPQARPV
jgi:hypothetical protein